MGWWMCYLVHVLYLYNSSVNCLDTSFVCHSAQRYLNSASYTEAGPLDLISDDETDDRLKLPGTLKGVWAVVSSVQLKAIQSSEHVCIYCVCCCRRAQQACHQARYSRETSAVLSHR